MKKLDSKPLPEGKPLFKSDAEYSEFRKKFIKTVREGNAKWESMRHGSIEAASRHWVS
jgi:hypothetical protein